MNRSEAKMIAEELHKLMKKDVKQYVAEAVKEETEEFLSTAEVAKLMRVSVSYINNNVSTIPHTKVGKLNRFKKSEIIRMLNR